MDGPELQDLRRVEIAAIVERHGHLTIGALRLVYGADFAPGFNDDSRLASIALLLDDPSLEELVKDHMAGTLESRIGDA